MKVNRHWPNSRVGWPKQAYAKTRHLPSFLHYAIARPILWFSLVTRPHAGRVRYSFVDVASLMTLQVGGHMFEAWKQPLCTKGRGRLYIYSHLSLDKEHFVHRKPLKQIQMMRKEHACNYNISGYFIKIVSSLSSKPYHPVRSSTGARNY